MNILKKIAISVSTFLAISAFAVPAFATNTVVVSPGNTQGWAQYDTRTGGDTAFVTDNSSPLPTGALQLTTDNTTAAKADYMHATLTPLDNLSSMSYSTKQVSASFAQGDPTYQLAVYLNGDASSFTTLVYEPYWNGTPTPNTWESWDVDSGQFWSSRNFTDPNNASCTVSAGAGGPPFYTLAGLKVACPDAVVQAFGVNVGSYNPSYTVETDAVEFDGTTYDFEADYAPSVPVITTPADGAAVTQSAFTMVDWTDSTDGSTTPTMYQYESYSDASYNNLRYTSSWLTSSQIATPGSPVGEYYLRVRSETADGVKSDWSNDAAHPYHITVTPDVVLVGPPVHKAQCDDNGWMSFNNPSFTNRGKCIDYVNHHNHAVKGNNVQYDAYGLNRSVNFDMNTANNKGSFNYTDADRGKYKVQVSEVKVVGNTAWFAGIVNSSRNNTYTGQWLFVKVVDNGVSGDQISGSFVADEATAKADVEAMGNPTDGPFTLFRGNIKVN